MANFVANSTANDVAISTGTLRKDITREMVYKGSWTIQTDVTQIIGGFNSYTNTVSDKLEYTFFGTGFDARSLIASGRSTDVRVYLNGVSATAGNFGTASFSTYGGTSSYDSVTNGSWNQNTASLTVGAGLVISGLPLDRDWETKRFQNYLL